MNDISIKWFYDGTKHLTPSDVSRFPFEITKKFYDNDLSEADKSLKNISTWLDKNIGKSRWLHSNFSVINGQNYIATSSYLLLLEEDAMAFKLRWL